MADLDVRGAKNLGAKLEANRESAQLSYQLATIKTDCELALAADDLKSKPASDDQLVQWFREMEFKSWLSDALAGEPLPTDEQEVAAGSAQPLQVETVLNEASWQRWLEVLNKAELFSFDTETTSLNYMEAEIVGVSFAVEADRAAYVPLAHDYPGAPAQLDRQQVLADLKPLLENPDAKKVGQNLKYDANVLANYGITLSGIAHDSMLESYVLDSIGTRHDMDSLALKYLGEKTITFEEVAGKGAKQLTFNQVAIEQAAPYAAEDAAITLRLHDALWPKLSAEPSLSGLYETLELPLISVLSRIERNGARIDRQRLADQSHELSGRLDTLEARAHELAGEAFNLGSPKQLGHILFEKLELPVLKKNAKRCALYGGGMYSRSSRSITRYPAVLMEYRSLSKLKSTYTDKLPEMISPVTGRVHTSYHQAVTATGRLSSSDPNLQNIPIRTEEGRRIRQAFCASPGYRIVGRGLLADRAAHHGASLPRLGTFGGL